MVTSEQVEQYFQSLGFPLDQLFLITRETENFGSIVIWHPEFGARGWLIENDEMAQACYGYLVDYGARTFSSWEEFRRAVATEKWPGWDSW